MPHLRIANAADPLPAPLLLDCHLLRTPVRRPLDLQILEQDGGQELAAGLDPLLRRASFLQLAANFAGQSQRRSASATSSARNCERDFSSSQSTSLSPLIELPKWRPKPWLRA